MSEFFTSIPVDVEAIKKLLPKDHRFEGLEWHSETQSVRVLWDGNGLSSGVTYRVEWPVEQLQARKMPEGVGPRKAPEPPKAAIVAAAKPIVALPKPRRAKCATCGMELDFTGSRWLHRDEPPTPHDPVVHKEGYAPPQKPKPPAKPQPHTNRRAPAHRGSALVVVASQPPKSHENISSLDTGKALADG